MTVTVGLGTGSQQAVIQNVMAMAQVMGGIMQAGHARLVTEQNAYQLGHIAEKALFPKETGRLLTNPSTLGPKQPEPNPEMIELELKKQKMQLQDEQKKMKMQFDSAMDQQDKRFLAEQERFKAMVEGARQESEQRSKLQQEAIKAETSNNQIVLQGVVKQIEDYHKQIHESNLQQREQIASLIETKLAAKAKKEKPDKPAA